MLAAEQASEEDDVAATDLGGEDMIAIHPADWPRPRLVVEVLYRLIEQDGIPSAGPCTAHRAGDRRSWAMACAAPGTPAAAPETRAATDPGHQAGRGVRKS